MGTTSEPATPLYSYARIVVLQTFFSNQHIAGLALVDANPFSSLVIVSEWKRHDHGYASLRKEV